MAKYVSTKTYGNDRGLSCCFRQWRSTHSHCSLLHGYSIGIKLVFESETLDSRNWVFDFGGLKAFKSWADYMFDHTLVIAEDDPEIQLFLNLDKTIADVRLVPGVGCEKFSELAYTTMDEILTRFKAGKHWEYFDHNKNCVMQFTADYPVGQDVKLRSVEVFEHGANSAVYEGLIQGEF